MPMPAINAIREIFKSCFLKIKSFYDYESK